jgi:hypothetical protein
VVAALRGAPQPSMTVETPLLGGLPFTDAAGFVFVQRERKAPLPYASWISAPCYLITADDTPAWIDPTRIGATRATVDALVEAFMR